MPKGSVLEMPTDEEVRQYADPSLALQSAEDMEEQAPATWRDVLDRIGRQEARRLGIDDKMHIAFGFPKPKKKEDGTVVWDAFHDANNPNLHFRLRISAPPLSTMELNQRLQSYEWWFQVFLSYVQSDYDRDGELRDGVQEFATSQEVEARTEMGVKTFVTVNAKRYVKESGISRAYTQDVIDRLARHFVRKEIPAMCKEHGVAPPRQRGPIFRPTGTEETKLHAHEVFRVNYY